VAIELETFGTDDVQLWMALLLSYSMFSLRSFRRQGNQTKQARTTKKNKCTET